MSRVTFEPVRIDTQSDDEDGRLIMVGERLVGVLVRLDSPEQAPLLGYWSLEAGFGPLGWRKEEPFETLDAVRDWVEGLTGGPTDLAETPPAGAARALAK